MYEALKKAVGQYLRVHMCDTLNFAGVVEFVDKEQDLIGIFNTQSGTVIYCKISSIVGVTIAPAREESCSPHYAAQPVDTPRPIAGSFNSAYRRKYDQSCLRRDIK